ncbi:hypothetical protein BAUCODRAFT_37331 [Baudoinia panamericana UAMH 10762]|uniref:Uncharacterized protein n=1 Tax=Baudoinia panamericana (strain UAMH 10762) TaxID=717646 RepID=M2MAZ3_BAUPA|nr:uncharacterized protein BAUCODRAFT_37331 [Baudoinia panamericana UAMH 10762]EMC93636.1 hypothetical protein BAUCODRAFT_37331 [Baudoinia panamericana UAMH 10762]
MGRGLSRSIAANQAPASRSYNPPSISQPSCAADRRVSALPHPGKIPNQPSIKQMSRVTVPQGDLRNLSDISP